MNQLTINPSIFYAYIWDDIPKLTPLNWTFFSSVMEMFFYSQDADYLVGSGPSTTVPPNCIILDQQLFSSLLLFKIDDELKPIVAKTSSALEAWLLLTEHFQGPFPSSPPVCDDIMDTSVPPPVTEDSIIVTRPLFSVDQSTIIDDVSVPDVDHSIMDTIVVSSVVPSLDVGIPSSPVQDIKCPSAPVQNYPIMDIRSPSPSLLVFFIADVGKASSYDLPLLAIFIMASLIKTILSHVGLATVTWPLTPYHLFHEWPPPPLVV